MKRPLTLQVRLGMGDSLGEYDPVTNVISINKRLLAKRIPRWVLSCVVWHEFLHAFCGEINCKWHHKLHCLLCFLHPEYYRLDGWLDDCWPLRMEQK